jgi:hypothetical protein
VKLPRTSEAAIECCTFSAASGGEPLAMSQESMCHPDVLRLATSAIAPSQHFSFDLPSCDLCGCHPDLNIRMLAERDIG